MKIINYIANFFKEGTAESSMRVVFIFSAIGTILGVLSLDAGYTYKIFTSTVSGSEIAFVITANWAGLGLVLYGKNKSKEIETK
jgi:hypothetical protein